MADRRDFMGYIGTGAIGSIVGYYAGAQKLLGIQPEEPTEESPEESTEESPEESTEESPEDTPAELATFETDSLNSWENVDNAKITDQESFSGSQSVVITDQNEDGGIGNSIYRPVDSITPNQLSGAFRVSDGATPTVIIRWRDKQQNPVHTIRMSIPRNNIQYPGQQGRRPFYEGVETSNWYHVVLDNIDWEAGVVSEIKVNGEVVLEEDIQFPRTSSPITSVQLRCHSGGTGTTAHFDDVTIG